MAEHQVGHNTWIYFFPYIFIKLKMYRVCIVQHFLAASTSLSLKPRVLLLECEGWRWEESQDPSDKPGDV